MLTCELCGKQGDARGDSGTKIVSVKRLGLANVCLECGQKAVDASPMSDAERSLAKEARAKRRKNALAKERYHAMRDLGMSKTPYGWE